MRKSSLWFLVCFLALCFALLGISFTYPSIARTLPQLVLSLTIVFGLLELYQLLKTKKERPETEAGEPGVRKRLLVTIGATSLYLTAIPLIGYLVSTGAFLMALMILLKARNRLAMALSTLLMLVFIWSTFFWWLNVQPPRALIGF